MEEYKKKYRLNDGTLVQGCWLPSVGAAAAAAGSILADAVGADGDTATSVPTDASLVGLARLGVAADAVDAASPVPTCEFAYGECAAAVAAGAWEFERDCACHSFPSVFSVPTV